MKKSPIVTVVAIGIGAALFFVLGRFVIIPSPVPNTNISAQYGLLAFMAALFGPLAGLLIGLIGHALIDFSWGGSFGGIAPALDVLIYHEPTEKLVAQGLMAGVANIVTTAIIGTLLCTAYAAARPKKGSLKEEN